MSLFQKKAADDGGKAMDGAAPVENASKPVPAGRTPLTHRMWAKVAAFILVILMAALAVGCAAAASFMIEQEIYTTPQQSFRKDAFQNLAEGDMLELIQYVDSDHSTGGQEAVEFLKGRNIASAELIFSEDARRNWSYDSGKTESGCEYRLTLYHMRSKFNPVDWYTNQDDHGPHVEVLGTVEVSIMLANELGVQDDYYFADRLISVMYAMRYWVYGIGLGALILSIVCFVFLLCASGRRKGLPDPQPGWGTKIPFDLLAAGAGFGTFLTVGHGYDAIWLGSDGPLKVMLLLLAAIGMAVMGIGLCMSFALRVKLGRWWKNTVVFYALRLCWRVLRKLGAFFRALGQLLLKLPVVWKTALLIAGVFAYSVIAILMGLDGNGGGWGLLFLEGVVLIPAVLYAALMLRRLYQSSQALAAGDLSYQIDTKHLVWDFKKAAENLNSIGRGMTLAVEERTKSERMKTELITNVSHDIKTPLTSIINYSDLIEREPCENEKITEYAGVLHRQSERLKRLIDDLVEASKASTGNLEVLLAPCELNVLLTQTAGEYMQRMEDAGLELVTRMPEEEIRVMGDGRRMWRVLDNLANNICKYAMPGTRVYLSLEKQNGEAVIAFKNTSRLMLNISADELMERFARGDASRNTEGNGLGLSIAKSLTELQGGSLRLHIDGDLFKAELRFPII